MLKKILLLHPASAAIRALVEVTESSLANGNVILVERGINVFVHES